MAFPPLSGAGVDQHPPALHLEQSRACPTPPARRCPCSRAGCGTAEGSHRRQRAARGPGRLAGGCRGRAALQGPALSPPPRSRHRCTGPHGSPRPQGWHRASPKGSRNSAHPQKKEPREHPTPIREQIQPGKKTRQAKPCPCAMEDSCAHRCDQHAVCSPSSLAKWHKHHLRAREAPPGSRSERLTSARQASAPLRWQQAEA